MRRLAFIPAFVIAFLVAACSGGSASPSASSGAPASPAGGAASAAASSGASTPASGGTSGGAACAAAPAGATAVVTVTVKDFKFSPQPVQAKVGDVIVWSNQDSAPHSATLDDGTCDTKTINSGAQAGLVFSAPGTYTYHCAIHPTQMKGYTIEVK
jgi:plastocyanin